jgi:FMN phosphatase YigB (HAD superfamily)
MIKTIFCDIDGTLLRHHGDGCLYKAMKNPPELLPNVMNDSKPHLNETAIAIVVERNKGFTEEHMLI